MNLRNSKTDAEYLKGEFLEFRSTANRTIDNNRSLCAQVSSKFQSELSGLIKHVEGDLGVQIRLDSSECLWKCFTEPRMMRNLALYQARACDQWAEMDLSESLAEEVSKARSRCRRLIDKPVPEEAKSKTHKRKSSRTLKIKEENSSRSRTRQEI